MFIDPVALMTFIFIIAIVVGVLLGGLFMFLTSLVKTWARQINESVRRW